jgi:hypothetical protein
VHEGPLPTRDALVSKTSTQWHLESTRCHGPNVISCIFVHGTQRSPLIGVYLPPSNLDDLPFLTTALDRFPNQTPILLGDLNVNLADPIGDRNQEVAALMAAYGLEDMLPNYLQRRSFRHGTTWWQMRQGELIRSRCDYILGSDRRLFQTVA